MTPFYNATNHCIYHTGDHNLSFRADIYSIGFVGMNFKCVELAMMATNDYT